MGQLQGDLGSGHRDVFGLYFLLGKGVGWGRVRRCLEKLDRVRVSWKKMR